MRFVQYYFGLPLAMIVICITFIPIFRKLNVYTAYEYLEQRFDRRTRLLAAVLFLLSRGLSTGISIYAPSIILSSIMGWNIYLTNIITGGLLIIYTYAGGAKSIAHTQKLLLIIILSSMAIAGYLVVHDLPQGMGMSDALYVAGKSGKLNVITTNFDWKDRYNIWSGLIGGFFLALSYFGTDQSQVGRYLTAKDLHESRVGLLLNGLVKVPMQFCILLIGALLFAFYSFYPAPVHFNEQALNAARQQQPTAVATLERQYATAHKTYETQATAIVKTHRQNLPVAAASLDAMKQAEKDMSATRDSLKKLVQATGADANDTNYIFLHFVKHSLPAGLVGLLFAAIFLASWGSISAAFNSLAASSLMDIQFHNKKELPGEQKQLMLGRLHTLAWGIFCIATATFAAKMGSLIEAVNILGSLFYGTILGIFLVAFYMPRACGKTVFTAAVVAELAVVLVYSLDIVSFLWLNVIGALIVVLICILMPSPKKRSQTGRYINK
jgi:Na+/proline symporter